MNNHNTHLNNTQQWMMPPEHGPEQYNYMISRPPGSVLPMPPPHQQQQQHARQLSRDEELSISPQAQALDYDPTKYKGPNRPVIPSKRAAQNRAAQKAFRQRREQYIKDLEIKAKEMEDWQNELDRLRKENGELRERVGVLENQVSILTGGDPTKIPAIQPPLPLLSTANILPKSPELNTTNEKERENERENIRRESSTTTTSPQSYTEQQQQQSFTTVPLRAPNRSSPIIYHDPDSSDTNKRRKLDDSPLSDPTTQVPPPPPQPRPSQSPQPPQLPQPSQQSQPSEPHLHPPQLQPQPQPHSHPHQLQSQQQPHPPMLPHPPPPSASPLPQPTPQGEYWNNSHMQVPEFDLDFDFDPFFEEEFGPTLTHHNDFLPSANSGQVLDDLFAMLQTRQRPQIPIAPTTTNEENFDTT